MQPKFQLTYNGQEVETSDLNTVAEDAALADDRVLAELFRLKPYDSGTNPTLTKAILSYSEGPTVVPNGATGSIRVYPCRAMMAAKIDASVDSKENWKGIRSQVFIGNATAAYTSQSFDAGAVSDRWDTVYIRLDKDLAVTSVTRYVKSPTTPFAETPNTVDTFVNTTATLGVVKGTPGNATPPVPPTDTATAFCIPLAYVRIPVAFTSGSTVATTDIVDAAPTIVFSRSTGACTIRPATVQNDIAGDYLTSRMSLWLSGTRPAAVIPRCMVGEEVIYIALSAMAADNSILDDQVVDRSRDWRNRIFTWMAQVEFQTGGAPDFSWNIVSPYADKLPSQEMNGFSGFNNAFGFGQSFIADTSIQAKICELTNSNCSYISGSNRIILYVDMSTGAIKFTTEATTPEVKIFVRLCASSPYPNK